MTIIHVVEARPVARAGIKGTVWTEGNRADGMTGKLLCPVMNQYLLRTRHEVAAGRQARQPAANPGAAAGWVGTRIGQVDAVAVLGRRDRRNAAGRRTGNVAIVRVQHIYVRIDREIWGQRHAQQATVPKVVDVDVQVGKQVRRLVDEAIVHPNASRFFGDKYAAIRGELHDRRIKSGR